MRGPPGRIFGRLIPPGAARFARGAVRAAAGLCVLLTVVLAYIWFDTHYLSVERIPIGNESSRATSIIFHEGGVMARFGSVSPLEPSIGSWNMLRPMFGYQWAIQGQSVLVCLFMPYWFMFSALLVLPTTLTLLWWRRRQSARPAPGRCRQCGYDLRATPDRCPECGTPATKTRPAHI